LAWAQSAVAVLEHFVKELPQNEEKM